MEMNTVYVPTTTTHFKIIIYINFSFTVNYGYNYYLTNSWVSGILIGYVKNVLE